MNGYGKRVRHVTLEQAARTLRRGKEVQQLLPSEPHDGRPTVRRLAIGPEDESFVVRLHRVFDPGDPAFLDISEFEPVDANEEVGEGVEVARDSLPEGALATAAQHGAVPDRWVNQGLVENEYADARSRA